MSRFLDRAQRVVVVHDPDHAEWQKAIEDAKLSEPLEVKSFVEGADVDRAALGEAALISDTLVIQESLLGIKGTAAELAISAVMNSPLQDRDVHLFDDNYRIINRDALGVIPNNQSVTLEGDK